LNRKDFHNYNGSQLFILLKIRGYVKKSTKVRKAGLIVVGFTEKFPLSPAISILNTLLRNGVPISHLCGGKAVCGTCRIKILEGEENLSPMQEAERVRLTSGTGKQDPPPHTRLACQSYARGDITIKILAPGTRKTS